MSSNSATTAKCQLPSLTPTSGPHVNERISGILLGSARSAAANSSTCSVVVPSFHRKHSTCRIMGRHGISGPLRALGAAAPRAEWQDERPMDIPAPSPTVEVRLTVNGVASAVDVEARTLLVHLMRANLRLTGTHVGCDTSNCGACTVLLDGMSVKSCTVLAAQADGGDVTTIEGLAGPDGTMSPVQEGFHQEHGLQCGYCT